MKCRDVLNSSQNNNKLLETYAVRLYREQNQFWRM